MKFLKTDFGKVHLCVMLFGVTNVLMALLLRLRLIPYMVGITIHQWSGFLLFPILLLTPTLFAKRRQIYTAIKARLLINSRDIKQRNGRVILAKTVTMLMLLSFLLQVTSAILLKTGVAAAWYPAVDVYGIHTSFVFIIPVLIILHPILMKWSVRKKAAKPDSAA